MSTISDLKERTETIHVRRAADRGHVQYDWLDTWHTFSFDTYYDPAHMGFRALRVINEDHAQPGQGFGMHGHRDMEIITYVLEGALEHRDSLGTGSVLRPGEFQHMSAGTGIRHSEFNPSSTEPVHLYQIWLLPDRNGLSHSYDQKTFPEAVKRGRLRLVASPDAQDGSLVIHQDARVYLSTLDTNQEVGHELQPGRHEWLQVLRGSVDLNGQTLATSDGAAVSDANMKPGKAVHRAHRHAQEEYLILVEGSGTWSLDGKESPAKRGDILYVEPWVYHGLTNTGTEPLIFVVVRFNSKGVKLPPRPDNRPDEQ